jgi:hypothetical protein
VTTDPNNIIQSNHDNKEGPPKPDAKHGHKDTYQNTPLVPSTIQVKKSSNSHITSSVPRLSS